jgi:hypothetical protein
MKFKLYFQTQFHGFLCEGKGQKYLAHLPIDKGYPSLPWLVTPHKDGNCNNLKCFMIKNIKEKNMLKIHFVFPKKHFEKHKGKQNYTLLLCMI